MMQPENVKKTGTGQLNFNTILLGICVTLSGWALKSIEELKEEMVGVKARIEVTSNTTMDQNRVIIDQSKTIEQLSNRLTIIETKENDKNKN